MMDGFRMAYVYVCNVLAGQLRETDSGYCFEYDEDYLKRETKTAVSLTLPLREEPFQSTTLFSFFDGLIPEGWLLDTVAHNWKLDPGDRFGLLLIACRDSIGNVSIEEVKR